MLIMSGWRRSVNFIVILVFMCLCCCKFCMAMKDHYCGSFDMRNSAAQFSSARAARLVEKFRKCTVIEGNVHYILMNTMDNESVTQVDYSYVALPNVREITGSLMVFQVAGLESLHVLLPNLRIIRGQNLIFNYAMVVFQNPDLKEIGLTNLMEISKGGVRISSNVNLCYSSTVNWSSICRNPSHIVFDTNQHPKKCSDTCSTNGSLSCMSKNTSVDEFTEQTLYCWNDRTCQKTCPSECTSAGLSCNLNLEKPECCHPECLGGCNGTTDRDCYVCRHVNVDGRCVPSCPPNAYIIFSRRCVTAAECSMAKSRPDENGEATYFKPLSTGICDINCPDGFTINPTNVTQCIRCPNDKCVKKCKGGSAITNLAELKAYKGCNIISGHLEIGIQSGLTKNVVEELDMYLGDIHEVGDYVKIAFSPSLVSLSMLKNLRVIHGKKLLNGKYAMSVFENQNLAQLWNFTHQLKIANGTIQFHNNPRLCYSTIMEMAHSIGLGNVSEHDVSKVSNGNKAVCEDVEITMRISAVERDIVVLHWEEFSTDMMDHRMFLGYQLYYRQVDHENVNIFDGRDACHDSWQMIFIEPTEFGTLVPDLKPDTLYAFYLTTLMVYSNGSKGGMSKVLYQRTRFGPPSPPITTKIDITSSSIEFEWKPPLEPNGQVTHYVINYVERRDVLPKERNYCEEPPAHNNGNDKLVGEGHSISTNGSQVILSLTDTSAAAENTCSKLQCCQCPATALNNGTKSAPDSQAMVEQKEKAMFENVIHNIVFVNNKRRKRLTELTTTDKSKLKLDSGEPKNPLGINVTDLHYKLTGLHHFTLYDIRIWACQNANVTEASCSLQEALISKRTLPIKHKDTINHTSIGIVNETELNMNVRFISWDPPEEPNGLIAAYRIEYFSQGSSSSDPKKLHCISATDFAKTGGVMLSDLTPGNWSVRIRSVSLAQLGEWSSCFYFLIVEPHSISNSLIILVAVGCSLIVTAIIALSSIFVYRRNFRKKLPEYLLNVFSANPEYISQLEVYKPDEWELKREEIELLHEIGRGTFGTVYAGMGKNVRSTSGVAFGECAVKTVSERASIYDRWHFLIEASVMKGFNVAYIVKLYGVVSEGQPALVVMEMMHRGNLKDYLRSRRPNSEENVEGLNPPTLKETLQWSGEIADGMAYLEAQKFCHRDLAARNCMVTAKGICKIGDFGMARDVYVKDYYRPTGKRLMPVRWMAPEALKDATFTSKSDIWSYGVVLWEMATLASQPYAGLSNEDVMRYVVDFRRVMEMPTGCPTKLYQLMQLCWSYDPKERPTFADIVDALLPDMNDYFRQVSYTCTLRGKESGRIGRNHCNSNDFENVKSAQVASPSLPLLLVKDSVTRANSMPMTADGEVKVPVCQKNRRGVGKQQTAASSPKPESGVETALASTPTVDYTGDENSEVEDDSFQDADRHRTKRLSSERLLNRLIEVVK